MKINNIYAQSVFIRLVWATVAGMVLLLIACDSAKLKTANTVCECDDGATVSCDDFPANCLIGSTLKLRCPDGGTPSCEHTFPRSCPDVQVEGCSCDSGTTLVCEDSISGISSLRVITEKIADIVHNGTVNPVQIFVEKDAHNNHSVVEIIEYNEDGDTEHTTIYRLDKSIPFINFYAE